MPWYHTSNYCKGNIKLYQLQDIFLLLLISSLLLVDCCSKSSSFAYYNIIEKKMLVLSSKQYTSCLGFVHKTSCALMASNNSYKSYSNIKVRRLISSSEQWRYKRRSKSLFNTHNMQQSSTSSESVMLPQSTDITNNVKSNDGLQQHDTYLWFTQMLPEGCCVGVCTTKPSSSATPILSDIIEDLPSLNSTTFLHSDEYSWGQSNIASDSSRTSYYLGRTAIRLSINTLIRNRTMNQENAQDLNNNSSNNTFYSQLNDQIESTAIRKDYYGRPILPEIILGSISHKGNYAVGLSRFRDVDEELKAVDIDALQWREECLISDDDDTSENTEIDDASCSSSTTTRSVRGIGIDLEFIDIKRGKRIKKRVLTENEQKELGQLEVRDTHRHVHTLSDLYHAATSFAISMLVLKFILYCRTISRQLAYQGKKKYC